jgi:hypothetical protein
MEGRLLLRSAVGEASGRLGRPLAHRRSARSCAPPSSLAVSELGDAGVRGDKERVEGLIDGHVAGQAANPPAVEQRLAARIQEVERAPWGARAGVHNQRDRGRPGPMTTNAMTEPWSRVRTTMAAKAVAPPMTTTAMRRLSIASAPIRFAPRAAATRPTHDPASRRLRRAARRPRDAVGRPG